jgi:hypothetical protein
VNQGDHWTNADIGAFQVAKNSARTAVACHLLEQEEICTYPNEGLFAQWKKLLQRRVFARSSALLVTHVRLLFGFGASSHGTFRDEISVIISKKTLFEN